jgi:hypothetical protein
VRFPVFFPVSREFSPENGSVESASTARFSAYLIGLKRKYKIISDLKSFIIVYSGKLNSFLCPQFRSSTITCGNHHNAGLSEIRRDCELQLPIEPGSVHFGMIRPGVAVIHW